MLPPIIPSAPLSFEELRPEALYPLPVQNPGTEDSNSLPALPSEFQLVTVELARGSEFISRSPPGPGAFRHGRVTGLSRRRHWARQCGRPVGPGTRRIGSDRTVSRSGSDSAAAGTLPGCEPERGRPENRRADSVRGAQCCRKRSLREG
eukprot:749399-Hanusia_phi.AAC.2